jgi:hypothetical protein
VSESEGKELLRASKLGPVALEKGGVGEEKTLLTCLHTLGLDTQSASS